MGLKKMGSSNNAPTRNYTASSSGFARGGIGGGGLSAYYDMLNRYNQMVGDQSGGGGGGYGGGGGGGGGVDNTYAIQLLDMNQRQLLDTLGQQHGRTLEDLNNPTWGLLSKLATLFSRNTEGVNNQMLGRGLYNSGIRTNRLGRLNQDYTADTTQAHTTARRSLEDIDRQIRQSTEEYNLRRQMLTGG